MSGTVVTIPPALTTTALHLVTHTALDGCTRREWRGHDLVVHAAAWGVDNLSTGERELWDALVHLAETGLIPELNDTHLDPETRAGVEGAREILAGQQVTQ